MLVDVYKSSSNPEKFLSVPAGTDIKKFDVAALDQDYQVVSAFKKGVDVDPSILRVALSSAEIIRDIGDHGFATHNAHVATTLVGR